MPEQNTDPELQAIQHVVEALEPLDPDARTRVLVYIFQRLNLSLSNVTNSAPPIAAPIIAVSRWRIPTPASTFTDIRTLKAAKQPKSDNQMAALVAYYLRELAPIGDRKQAISHEDIEKYFKQAGYPLPKRIVMTLTNAKSAGYFDSAGSGLFNLNPVGHNLVVHGMPSSSPDRKHPRKHIKKTAAKKKTK